jgi:hypothetical protein
MSEAASAAASLSIDELSALRDKTDRVGELLKKQLTVHLETIRPLLSPRTVLGRHVAGGEDDRLAGADRAYEELRAQYTKHAGRPFSLPKDLEDDPVDLDGRIDLHPWEYSQKVGDDGKVITMASPLRWVVSYRSGYAPAQLRRHVDDRKSLRRDDAKRFVLSALTFGAMLAKQDEVAQLLRDLRYQIVVEPFDGLGELPLVSIASCVPSIRPPDDLILQATKLAGLPAFIEVVDVDSVARLGDPIREKIEEILR